ncbi:MAG TPA: GlsB/YeaQ/YmgE family stress response membrane protein [Propionibacteriaceae bacterium]|nr:GlsB/YeaQ/YmgE family stress response membrane protein [Propionibacteriaceae bacterium]
MEVTGLITALIVGLIIGALGRLVAPGRQKIPIWLTFLVGIAAALIGTALAAAIGVAVTPGIDWIELIIQVVLAAVGVTTADGLYGRRSART